MKKEPLSIIAVKTLLAVIIFVGVGTIIVGGGYLIGKQEKISEPVKLIRQQSIKEKITVTTNKTEYEWGDDMVEVTIKNNSDEAIIYQAPYICSGASLGVEKLVNDNWMPDFLMSSWCVAKDKILESDSMIVINLKLEENFRASEKFSVYRILFKYSNKTIYSNEFMIKEKSAKEVTITTDKTEYEQGGDGGNNGGE